MLFAINVKRKVIMLIIVELRKKIFGITLNAQNACRIGGATVE